METNEKVIEAQRETPVVARADVVVVGGGAAGIGAAIAAARNGGRVILIERNQFLGGTATAGLMIQSGGGRYGIYEEFQNRMVKLGGAIVSAKHGIVPFEPEIFKCVADEMMEEAGVNLLFETIFADAIVENNVIKGVILQTKAGRQAVLADVVVDTTGDGDVAAAAGAPYILGRTEDNLMQPFGLLFRMGNVNIDKLAKYCQANPQNFTSQDPQTHIVDPEEKIVRVQGFFSQLEEAIAKGEMDPNIRYIRLDGVMVDKGTVIFNTTRVYKADGTKSEDLTRGNIIARRKMMQLVNFAKKYMPGFENAFLDYSASYMGVRETRHIVGDYMMTYEDVVEKRQHDDDIYTHQVVGYPEKEAIVHYPSRIIEGSEDDVYSRERVRKLIGWAGIPYRSLVPKKIDGILLAGRNISADHYAANKGGGGRGISAAMLLGQVSGTAAVLSIRDQVAPRNLNVKKLQRTLTEQGYRLEGIQ